MTDPHVETPAEIFEKHLNNYRENVDSLSISSSLYFYYQQKSQCKMNPEYVKEIKQIIKYFIRVIISNHYKEDFKNIDIDSHRIILVKEINLIYIYMSIFNELKIKYKIKSKYISILNDFKWRSSYYRFMSHIDMVYEFALKNNKIYESRKLQMTWLKLIITTQARAPVICDS